MAVLSSGGQILVVNAGSTSLKLSLVAVDESSVTVGALTEVDQAAIAGVAHRVVHGGARFSGPVVIDDEIERVLVALTELAPLHNGRALATIREARRVLPGVPHVAAFDTAFHTTIPDVALTYALASRFREQHGIRRFGFHGLSVQWAAEQVQVPRLVVCHLGGGCSVTAVQDGRSVDTTMGFTPLEGVPMATRSGSVDPGALMYLLRRGVSLDELERSLEHESGLLGLSGISGNVEELEASDTPEAALALEVFAYRVAAAVAAMAAALDGLDALVFTGGIGEHSSRVRAAVSARLGFLGIEGTTPSSGVRVVVVPSREEVVAARAARELL